MYTLFDQVKVKKYIHINTLDCTKAAMYKYNITMQANDLPLEQDVNGLRVDFPKTSAVVYQVLPITPYN